MSSPMQAWNAWCALSLQTARLGWEAQNVIALRLMRMAAQSPGNQTETRRMVTEKVAALAEAQAATVAAVMKGSKNHRVAKKVLGVYEETRACQPAAADESVARRWAERSETRSLIRPTPYPFTVTTR